MLHRRSRQVRVVVNAVDTGGPGVASGMSGGNVSLLDEDESWKPRSLVRTETGDWATTFRFRRGSRRSLLARRVAVGRGRQRRCVGYNRLESLGYPHDVVVRRSVPRQPLRIRSLDLGTSTVDTRRQSKTIPVTLRLSGTGYAPGNQVKLWAKEYSQPHRTSALLRQVPGSPNTYRGGLRIPRWQTRGLWRLTRVGVESWFELHGLYEAQFDFADLRRAGADRRFRVISGPDDRSDPEVRRFGLSPDRLDVRLEPGSVTARVRIRDTVSGVSEARLIVRHLDTWVENNVPLHRTAGTRWLGTWEGAAVTLDTCEPNAGTWRTALLEVTDRSGNRRRISGLDLAAAGWPNSFTVVTNDNRPPRAKRSSPTAEPDNVGLQFDEDVTGVSTDTVILYVAPELQDDVTYSLPGPPIPGSWTCQNEQREATDCLTGVLRYATFDPAGDDNWDIIELNPNHQLGLMDLAGNPPDRWQFR